MLDINEKERVDFISLNGVMPEYNEICDFFYKLKNNLYDEELEE